MSRNLLILANNAIKEKAKRWVDAVPLGTRIEFREARRSTAQSDKMWAMLGDISKQVTHQGRVYNSDRWKVLFLYALGQETEFLPSLDGMSFIPYGPRSSELSKGEMSELIECMTAWGVEHGVIFHDPETKKEGISENVPSGHKNEKEAGDEPSPPTPVKEARSNAPVLQTSTQR